MKILLIQSLSKNLRPVFPVGLARIISVIKDRHEVKVFDPNLVPRQHLRLLREILKSFQPDVTGISLRNIDSIDYIGREYFYPDFVAIVQLVKKESPDTRLVVGGGSFSLFSESIMKDRPEIDAGVLLDAEASFPELLDHLDHPEKVKGIYLKKGQSIIFTGHRSPVDLDQLPWPSYEFFDLDRYLSRIIGIGIESKRGCLLKCAYCPYPFLTGSHIRKRNPVNVVDEIEYLVNHYNIKTFSFLDSVFNLPLSHAEAIISEISKRNLKIQWSCWTNEKYFTESFARTAIKAGCVSFPFSTDAFSDQSLKLLGKNYSNQDILNTVDVAEKIDNINIGYSFFLNPPGATTTSFFQMIRFLIKTKLRLGSKMKTIFRINRIRIEPHTKIHQLAIEEGLIKPETDLLKPIYYTQSSTRHLEMLYGILSFPVTMLIRFKRGLKRLLGR